MDYEIIIDKVEKSGYVIDHVRGDAFIDYVRGLWVDLQVLIGLFTDWRISHHDHGLGAG
jgi:hypothetical protein